MNGDTAFDFGFRLVYNGETRTDRIQGCSKEICDIQVLLDRVTPFAVRDNPGCFADANTKVASNKPSSSSSSASASVTNAGVVLHSKGGLLLLLSVVFVSALLGAFMGIHITQRYHRHQPLPQEEIDYDDEDFVIPPIQVV